MVAVVHGSLETLGRKLLGFDTVPIATVTQWPLESAKAFGASRGGAYAERAADPLHSARIKTEASGDLADAVAGSLSGL